MAKKAGGVSKADMVRNALEVKGWTAKPGVYQEYILSEFKTELPLSTISQYKSAERRKLGKKPARRRGEAAVAEAGGDISGDIDGVIAFITTVQNWEKKIGSKNIKKIVKKLYA